jgi:hypothetical protein
MKLQIRYPTEENMEIVDKFIRPYLHSAKRLQCYNVFNNPVFESSKRNRGNPMANLPANFALLCGGFFFLITLGIGVALLVLSARSKQKAGASLQWPATPGTVILSEIRQSSNTDDDGHTTYSYYPHVEYSYTVAGQTYTCKQIAFGGVVGHGTPQNAQATLAKYPLHAPVQVYYDPGKPEDAVLERVASAGAKGSKTVGMILLVLSALIACPLIIGLIRNF